VLRPGRHQRPEGVSLEDLALEDLALEDMALEDLALEDLTFEHMALEDLALEDVALDAPQALGGFSPFRQNHGLRQSPALEGRCG